MVFGHRLAVEIRELAQGVSVGDPFAQFPVIPTFDPHDDERAQNLLWRQSAATSPGVFQTALQFASYRFDQFLVVVKKTEMFCSSGSNTIPAAATPNRRN